MGKYIDNCSCVIVGKNATTTGKVLVAHNEDDMNCVVQLHLVPRIKHKEGDVITFDDAPRVIPEVPETYAYYWSEVRGPGGESFADGFANEFGVIVVSDSCVASKVTEDDPQPMGIGAGLRRLIAERARTAREGVEVAAELVTKYGYRSSRAYTIADKDEAWVFMATTGPNYVAQRVGDDQIVYFPNWYSIRKVDFSDTEHRDFYWSDTLVDYPLRHGWYKPAVDGDYSDFDFSDAYITKESFIPSNILRSDLAWSHITGEDPEKYRRVFSIKAPKKYSVDDLKAILRLHYTGWEKDLESDPKMSPHRYGICRDAERESMVVEFNEVTELTCMWRATRRPCANPYVPFYLGITKIPEGYEWTNVIAAQRSHLSPDEDDFKYHPERAFWAFHMLQNIMEFDYLYCMDKVHSDIAAIEAEWRKTKPEIDKLYLKFKDLNSRYASAILTDYTAACAKKAWDWARDEAFQLVTMKDKANSHFWRSKL